MTEAKIKLMRKISYTDQRQRGKRRIQCRTCSQMVTPQKGVCPKCGHRAE